jgi:signal transduction histidine kinase
MPSVWFDLHRTRHALSHGIRKLRWCFHRKRLPPALQPFAHSGVNPLSLRLHDEVGQWLALSLLHLDTLRASRTDIHETLTPLRTSLERATQAMRNIVREEQASRPSVNSLLEAIQHALATSPWSHHPLQCTLGPELAYIAAEAAPLAMRAISELVGNAHRHAYARQVHLRVWCQRNMLHVWVDDDGIGMANADDHQHFGLRSLRYQVASEGGALHLCAKPGIGTRVAVDFPLRIAPSLALSQVGRHQP